MGESRVKKSILNAKVNGIFYFLTLAVSFVSRKVFLANLGDEFIGLTGTLNNFLSFLSLSEMGIGTAIAFNLYSPLQQGNREKVSELISLIGYFFQKVGIFVGVSALGLSFFFPLIFADTQLPYLLIFVTFYSQVCSALITYLINYRQIVLAADQRNYVVAGYTQSLFLLKILVQMILVYIYQNLYVWVLLEFLLSWLAGIALNFRINVNYPWLHVDLKRGKELMKRYPEVLRSSKQVFAHSLKDFAVNRCDQLLVFLYVSLDMVAHYGNYLLIITKSVGAFNAISGSMGASIGHLVAEGDHRKIMKVFWELMTMQLLIAGMLSFGFSFFISPFIGLWLGERYILSTTILALLVVSNFLAKSLETIKSFNHAYGHYADVWSVWIEGGLFLGVTLCLAPFWGIAGVLIGRISSLVFDLLWKPYYLFSAGLRVPTHIFWSGFLRNVSAFLVSFFLVYLLYCQLDIQITSWGSWIFNAVSFTGCFVTFYLLALLAWGWGAKDLLLRIPVFRNIFRKGL